MRLFSHFWLLRIYILLVVANLFILLGSQYYVYTKHWDLYWFSSFFYRALLLCVSYFLAFWLISLLPKALQKLLAWGIVGLSAVCFVVDIFLLYTFDTNLNSYLVIVALESNPSESAEFLHNYLSLPLFGIYALFIALFAALWHFAKPLYVLPRYVYGGLSLGIGILAFMILSQTKPLNEDWGDMLTNYTRQIYRAIDSTRNFIEEYKQLNARFDELSSSLEVKSSKEKIANLVLVIGESTQRGRMSLYGYAMPTTPRLMELKKSQPDNLFIFSNVIAPHAQTHESLSLTLTMANQDNTQGIDTRHKSSKKTAPKSPKGGADVKPTIKPTIKPWYEYLNIIDALSLGGYHTIALSNQEPVSLFGNAAATILKRAQDVEFVNINDKMSTTKFDESLLELLDKRVGYKAVDSETLSETDFQADSETDSEVKSESSPSPAQNPTPNPNQQPLQNLAKPQSPQTPQTPQDIEPSKPRFFALHLMGNHAKYYNRYPSEFATFAPSDMPCGNLRAKEWQEENAHYDNSVRYGDYVLREIIKRFEEGDSLVLYFSDHGEEVYDWRAFIGHSDSKISRFMVEIPFIIYVSEGFKVKHKALYKRIKEAQNQPYMNDDLFHTLLDMAGVSLKGYEKERSLLSKSAFIKTRHRLVGEKKGLKNYDSELREEKSYLEQGLCEEASPSDISLKQVPTEAP